MKNIPNNTYSCEAWVIWGWGVYNIYVYVIDKWIFKYIETEYDDPKFIISYENLDNIYYESQKKGWIYKNENEKEFLYY